jgi:hypothetical protein
MNMKRGYKALLLRVSDRSRGNGMKKFSTVMMAIILSLWGLNTVYGASYSYTSFDYPEASATAAMGINNSGTIVGQYTLAGEHGFSLSGTNFTTLNPPGAGNVNANGINDEGTIVGEYLDMSLQIHGFVAVLNPEPVSIDIKPGDETNRINLNEHGVIPVAILDSADLDVNEINPSSLSLQGLSLKMVGKTNRLLTHFEDIDGDGYTDLIAQFEDSDGWAGSGDGYATITGSLYDGTPIEGIEIICIVPR